MIWLIRHYFQQMSRRVAPDKTFVKKLRLELEDRGYLLRRSYGFCSVFTRIALSSSTALSLLFSTGVYAYASSSVLPDHFLYPVRSAVESVELAVMPAEKKEIIKLKHLQRRLKEERLLVLADRPNAATYVSTVISQMDTDLPAVTSVVENEESLIRETIAFHRDELSEIAQIHAQAGSEDKEFVREMLVDTVQRLEDQVQLIKNYKIEDRAVEQEVRRAMNKNIKIQKKQLQKTDVTSNLVQNDNDFVNELLESEIESEEEER